MSCSINDFGLRPLSLAWQRTVPVRGAGAPPAPDPGGATAVVNPTGEGAVSINEDAVQPESANIRLIVPTHRSGRWHAKQYPHSVGDRRYVVDERRKLHHTRCRRYHSVAFSSRLDLRFRPDAGRDTNATFCDMWLSIRMTAPSILPLP